MNWTLIVAIAGPVVTAVLVLVGTLVTANRSHHAAMEATRVAAKTAEVTAQVAVQDAFTRAYDKHWATQTEMNRKWNQELETRIGAVEVRAEEAEARAARAEHLNSVFAVYLRKVIRWIEAQLPGGNYPVPPPELNLDL